MEALLNLRCAEVISTTERLAERIKSRFPEANLVNVSRNVVDLARRAQERSLWISRPIYALRFLQAVLILLVGFIVYYVGNRLHVENTAYNLSELVQALEAATNEIILLAALFFGFISLEVRIKRARALKEFHLLRSAIHIIDMHQLTKDPSRLDRGAIWTPVSPRQDLDAFLLVRYLDYCSELLSLIGKIAAVYGEQFRDPVLLSALDEIENLSNGFSRKIWQKIMIIEQQRAR